MGGQPRTKKNVLSMACMVVFKLSTIGVLSREIIAVDLS